MDAKVTWRGNLSFAGTADTGFSVPLDGDDNGFRPMEMFAMGLAGCTAMDVISILGKKRQQVTGFEVQVHASRSEEHPKVFTGATIEYFVTGHAVDEAAVVRSIELSTLRYCPAQAMFVQIMPIELEYHIYEDLGEGERELVKNGSYVPAGQSLPNK